MLLVIEDSLTGGNPAAIIGDIISSGMNMNCGGVNSNFIPLSDPQKVEITSALLSRSKWWNGQKFGFLILIPRKAYS